MWAVGTVTGERDGEPLNIEAAWAFKLRDRKVFWGRTYEIPTTAFKDVGVSQHKSHADS